MLEAFSAESWKYSLDDDAFAKSRILSCLVLTRKSWKLPAVYGRFEISFFLLIAVPLRQRHSQRPPSGARARQGHAEGISSDSSALLTRGLGQKPLADRRRYPGSTREAAIWAIQVMCLSLKSPRSWRDLAKKRALSARRLFFVDGGSIN